MLATPCPAPCVTRPAETFVACIDASGAVPLNLARRAREKVRDTVRAAAATGPAGRASFKIRVIDRLGYNPDRHVLGIDLDAVPSPPPPPALPQSSFEAAKRNELIREYNDKQVGAWRTLVSARQRKAATGAETVMGISLTKWERGRPDTIGCVYRAASAYPGDGYRRLYILSDLTISADQLQGGTLNLHRVSVEVDFYCTDEVRVCDARKRTFRTLLLDEGHAHRVIFNDPEVLDRK